MKKIEMGKKYRTLNGFPVRVLCIDKLGEFPVVGLVDDRVIESWTADGSVAFSFNCSESLALVEVSPYEDIPIDTPGWARLGNSWTTRYFAGVLGGRPMTWLGGATSFTADGDRNFCDEFTTTKPEGVE